jgi:hypothetical protein
MTCRPPFGLQNADEHDDLEQSTSKRQRFTYQASGASAYTAEKNYNGRPFVSSDRALTSAMWPENSYLLQSEEQVERNDVLKVQNHLTDRSAGTTWHTSNQYTPLQATALDISTASATHLVPTPFVSAGAQPMMWQYGHINVPFRQAPPGVTIDSTTEDQVCFGMASHYQLILSGIVLT